MEFWIEEPIEHAHEVAARHLGVIGKYNERGELVTILTPEYGKIWYGDLDLTDEDGKAALAYLSLILKQTLIVETPTRKFELDYTPSEA